MSTEAEQEATVVVASVVVAVDVVDEVGALCRLLLSSLWIAANIYLCVVAPVVWTNLFYTKGNTFFGSLFIETCRESCFHLIDHADNVERKQFSLLVANLELVPQILLFGTDELLLVTPFIQKDVLFLAELAVEE